MVTIWYRKYTQSFDAEQAHSPNCRVATIRNAALSCAPRLRTTGGAVFASRLQQERLLLKTYNDATATKKLITFFFQIGHDITKIRSTTQIFQKILIKSKPYIIFGVFI